MKSVEIDRGKRLKDQPTTGHNRFHPEVPPILSVDEGEEVVLATRDGVDGQLGPSTSEADMANMEAGAIHPLTGPVFVKGAQPGDTLEIVGIGGRMTTALAEVPSAKLAVSVKPDPLLYGVGVRSEANKKKVPPSATAKLTAPLPEFRSAPSRLAETPRAQKGVTASVSQVPPPPFRRSSRRVTVRGPLPAWRITRKLPSSAPSGL